MVLDFDEKKEKKKEPSIHENTPNGTVERTNSDSIKY